MLKEWRIGAPADSIKTVFVYFPTSNTGDAPLVESYRDDSAPIYSFTLDNTVFINIFVVFSCVALFFTVIIFIYVQKRCLSVRMYTEAHN